MWSGRGKQKQDDLVSLISGGSERQLSNKKWGDHTIAGKPTHGHRCSGGTTMLRSGVIRRIVVGWSPLRLISRLMAAGLRAKIVQCCNLHRTMVRAGLQVLRAGIDTSNAYRYSTCAKANGSYHNWQKSNFPTPPPITMRMQDLYSQDQTTHSGTEGFHIDEDVRFVNVVKLLIIISISCASHQLLVAILMCSYELVLCRSHYLTEITNTLKLHSVIGQHKFRSLLMLERRYRHKETKDISRYMWTLLNFLVSCWYTYWASQGASRRVYLSLRTGMLILFTKAQRHWADSQSGTIYTPAT